MVLPASLTPGMLVGRYRVVRVIGRGGMGVVYEAEHEKMLTRVALKVIAPAGDDDAARSSRVLREARIVAAVKHPNVVQVLDFFEEEGAAVLVMELLEGFSLTRLRDRHIKLSLGDVASIMAPVAAAVQAAHDAGVVHRDLKPDNIFLSVGADATMVPKVLDFGIAKAVDGAAARLSAGAQDTATGVVVGTPPYMSREQALGERDIDGRTDVWSLGVITFELLAARRPSLAETLGQAYQVLLDPLPLPSLSVARADLPRPVVDAVTRCLQKQRADRASSPSLLRSALAPYARPLPLAHFEATQAADAPLAGNPTPVLAATPRAAPMSQPARPPERQGVPGTVALLAVFVGVAAGVGLVALFATAFPEEARPLPTQTDAPTPRSSGSASASSTPTLSANKAAPSAPKKAGAQATRAGARGSAP